MKWYFHVHLNPPDTFSSIFFPESTEFFISFCTIVQYPRAYFWSGEYWITRRTFCSDKGRHVYALRVTHGKMHSGQYRGGWPLTEVKLYTLFKIYIYLIILFHVMAVPLLLCMIWVLYISPAWNSLSERIHIYDCSLALRTLQFSQILDLKTKLPYFSEGVFAAIIAPLFQISMSGCRMQRPLLEKVKISICHDSPTPLSLLL